MKHNPIVGIHLFILVLVALSITGCASGAPQGSEHDAGAVTLCDFSEDLLGWRLSSTGEITFIDLSPSDGVYLELKDGGCGSQGFIHNDFWNTFDNELQQSISLGSTIRFEGILTSSNGDLLVSIQSVKADH